MPLLHTGPDPKSWTPPDVDPSPTWMRDARCLHGDEDPDDWFPAFRGAVPADSRAVEACGGCPVKDDCLQYALEIEGTLGPQSRHGIWGGLTPGQRAKLASGRAA